MKCPKCGSEKIEQYRMLTGPIWCGNCGFRAEQKEINNPFIEAKPSHEPSADSIMSAEPLARYLNQISQTEIPYDQCSLKVQRAYLEKATFILGFLQPLFAHQRERGRQEADKRYAALVEAARKRIDVSCKTCDWKYNCHGCAYSAIRKALRELDESKEAPHV